MAPGPVPGIIYDPLEMSGCIDMSTGLPVTQQDLLVPPGVISVELQVRGRLRLSCPPLGSQQPPWFPATPLEESQTAPDPMQERTRG